MQLQEEERRQQQQQQQRRPQQVRASPTRSTGVPLQPTQQRSSQQREDSSVSQFIPLLEEYIQLEG